jgi:hypothetical protein
VPRYGLIDSDYGMKLAASETGDPIYMLNLMKYRAEADYGRSGERGITGKDADCRYAPLDVLLATGASLCFVGDVLASQGGWDSVAVVRYPTRQSFIHMVSRPDFQARHVHREAGMERIIIMGTLPTAGLPAQPSTSRILLEVWHGPAPARLVGGQADAFDVEGTIIGDGRRWTGARYTAIEAGTPLPLQPPRSDYQALLIEPRIVRWQ